MWTFSMENSELSLLCEILSEVDKLREFFIVSMFRSPSTRPHADATSIAFGCGEWEPHQYSSTKLHGEILHTCKFVKL